MGNQSCETANRRFTSDFGTIKNSHRKPHLFREIEFKFCHDLENVFTSKLLGTVFLFLVFQSVFETIKTNVKILSCFLPTLIHHKKFVKVSSNNPFEHAKLDSS